MREALARRYGAAADLGGMSRITNARGPLRILEPVPQERVAHELQTAVHPSFRIPFVLCTSTVFTLSPSREAISLLL